MCFETTARPPAPPRTGFLGGHERLTLRSDADYAATFAGVVGFYGWPPVHGRAGCLKRH